MLNEGLKFYVEKKTGKGQSLGWRLKRAQRTLLLAFISMVLSFAVVLSASMAESLDIVLQYLGGGSVSTSRLPDSSLLPSDAAVSSVQNASAIAFSASSQALVNIRGVDDDYFFPQRAQALGLKLDSSSSNLEGIIISSQTASMLSVSPGDRLTLMVYDSQEGRVRPVFVFVRGTYNTGYSEFDSSFVFSSKRVAGSADEYEIMTEADAEALALALRSSGYDALSYTERYAAAYENISLSIFFIDLIVVLIGLLAGLFALNICAQYIENDRRDIALMMLTGCDEKQMAGCYLRITFIRVIYALIAGMAAGILLAFAFIPMLSSLDTAQFRALHSYVTNIRICVPAGTLVLTALALAASAFVSLAISLHRGISMRFHTALVS